MGNIERKLHEQAQMEEFAQDAEDCLKIYNALKDYDGHVWDSQWRVLTKMGCKKVSSEYVFYYLPSYVGRIFLNGLEKVV